MVFDTLGHDLKYAFRGLASKPGFAIAVVATLGLGIGANATMFGIVDGLLLRPPESMREPATAHVVYRFVTDGGKQIPSTAERYARYRDLTNWTTSFARTAGYTQRDLAVGIGEAAREMHIGIVSASFFEFFDAPPLLGRYFSEAEDKPPAGEPVAVLSYAMWQSAYGGRRDVLGSVVQIGPITYTVIGVAAKGFVGLWPDKPPAAFIPITSYAGGSGFTSRSTTWWETYGWSWMSMIVQRKPGVGIAAANADLTNALRRSWDAQVVEQPTTPPVSVARPQASVGPILAERGPNASNVAKVAAWVGGVSVAVLLIACANVANLLLARALRRRREIALRLALGASRGRLLSQLLTESVVLAVFGGISGLLLAHFAGAAIRTGLLQSEAAGGLRDPRTVLFATATAITVGLLTGIVPALQAGRADLTGDLKAGVREGTHRRSRARVALLVFQGALSVVLLVGAGLFVRSLLNVNETRLGFDADRVLLVDLNMRGVTLDSAPAVALRQRLLQAARETPGVEHVSMQWAVPFWSSRNQRLFVDGIDSLSHGGQDFYMNSVSPEYFATMGTRIVRGRGIADEDGPTAPRAMVVSEGMAKALWPGKNPIGQCLRVAADTMPCTYVVGIAENIKAQSLSDDSGFYYYVSAAQFRPQSGGLFVRTRDGSTTLAESVRRRLQREMPGASYVAITPLTDILGRQTRSWHLGATMFVAFGGLALLLAAIGLYSVIAYNVEQRTHELGVRRALGAQASDMVRLVVTDGLRLAGAGVALGVVAAFLAGRWIEPLLFNVSPRDPAVFAFVAATLVAVAMAASWIPALRGSRVDPNVALRSE